MSKNGKLYALILVNLLVWGYVGIKVFDALKGDDKLLMNVNNKTIPKLAETKNKEQTPLSLNYPDPFLKGFVTEKEPRYNASFNNTKNNTITHKKLDVPKPATVTATASFDVKYVGFIQNPEKGTQTALISINGKSFFTTVNQTIEGVLIKQITPSELTVIIDKKKVVIKK